ncbi:unnamed protein product [Gongylonema pulchrum]|uniref:Dirigent protein n=1 Tax=Gongylonema pulchrum TaxID=637853 RepID=A0A183DU02_9BILA|nr:unnamed protein product [Gongylonema pulchrum]
MANHSNDDLGNNVMEGDLQRLALGQLTGIGPNQEAPVIRIASQEPVTLFPNNQPRVTQNANSNSGFLVYQGNEVFNETNSLVPHSFADGLAHVAFVQNSWAPTKWKDARITNIPRTRARALAGFTVFAENEAVNRRTQEKPRALLLVADKVNSAEELLVEKRSNCCI